MCARDSDETTLSPLESMYVHLHVCVCVYVCMYVCMYVRTFMCMCGCVCVSGDTSAVQTHYCLKNVEDVKEFLGRHTEKLDKFIASFGHSFKEQERKGLRYHIVRNQLHKYFLVTVHYTNL